MPDALRERRGRVRLAGPPVPHLEGRAFPVELVRHRHLHQAHGEARAAHRVGRLVVGHAVGREERSKGKTVLPSADDAFVVPSRVISRERSTSKRAPRGEVLVV